MFSSKLNIFGGKHIQTHHIDFPRNFPKNIYFSRNCSGFRWKSTLFHVSCSFHVIDDKLRSVPFFFWRDIDLKLSIVTFFLYIFNILSICFPSKMSIFGRRHAKTKHVDFSRNLVKLRGKWSKLREESIRSGFRANMHVIDDKSSRNKEVDFLIPIYSHQEPPMIRITQISRRNIFDKIN